MCVCDVWGQRRDRAVFSLLPFIPFPPLFPLYSLLPVPFILFWKRMTVNGYNLWSVDLFDCFPGIVFGPVRNHTMRGLWGAFRMTVPEVSPSWRRTPSLTGPPWTRGPLLPTFAHRIPALSPLLCILTSSLHLLAPRFGRILLLHVKRKYRLW